MGRGGFSWHKSSHSSMMERCRRELLSGLPPTNFSIQPRDLENRRPWPEVHVGGAPVVTKSWLPTATRCGGPHRPPQLRHVSTGAPESPAPRDNRFVRDPDEFLETPTGMLEASHWWCLLQYSDAKKKKKKKPELLDHPPPAIPFQPSDHAGPKLELGCVSLGPNAPCSGLTVSYSLANYNTSWTTYRRASIRWECAVSDPFDSRRRPMEFTSMIRCGGKFYAISLQGAVAVVEVIGTRLQITAVGPTRAISKSRSRFFKEYLVEMKGEILIVFLIHHECVEVVDDVEVFRLDLDKLELIKVDRLRGKTMFLKERCDWVESAEFGCRDDCVFFTQGKENQWRVYDMKKCFISSVL